MILTKEHTLWVEKYRPTTLEDFVGNENLKDIIQKYLDQNDIQNLLFYGSAGCGKTTLAKLIADNLKCATLLLNASDERGIETIRDKVTSFASAASFQPLKVVVLDEADFLTLQAQASLRNVIEKYSKSTRFILTCNYIERIIDPLQSRCQTFKITPPDKAEVARHINKILDKKKIKYNFAQLKSIVNKFYPDIRKILNTCQSSVHDKELKLDKSILVEGRYKATILYHLKNPKNTTFNDLRQTIANSNITDFGDLYRLLYEKIDEYANGREGEIILYLEEYMYHSNFVIDKEINIMACLNKILQIIKQKQIL